MDSKNVHWSKINVVTITMLVSWLHTHFNICLADESLKQSPLNLFSVLSFPYWSEYLQGFRSRLKVVHTCETRKGQKGTTEARTLNISILTWFCCLGEHALAEVLLEKKPYFHIRSTCHIECLAACVELTGTNVRKHGRNFGEENSYEMITS
jgi:hypothetical protein